MSCLWLKVQVFDQKERCEFIESRMLNTFNFEYLRVQMVEKVCRALKGVCQVREIGKKSGVSD